MSPINDAELRRRLEALANVQPSAQATSRAIERVRQTILKNQRPHARESIGRIIMNSKWSRLAVAATVVLAAVLGLSLFTGNGAGKVYARAVSQLHEAKTLMYSVITKTGMDSMPTVRMDIAFKEDGDTGFIRTATPDGYITIAQTVGNKVKGIAIAPIGKAYARFELENVPDDAAKDPWAMVDALRALPAQADEVLGRKEIDGRTLDGFRIHSEDTVTTAWIDPTGGRIVRVELEFPNAPQANVIMTDFQLDPSLEDSFFSIEPPEGYVPIEMQADASEVGEQDFIKFLRMWSNWTVDRTFPPIVFGAEIAKITVQMAEEGKFKPGWDFGTQQTHQVMYRGLAFTSTLLTGTWRYAGQNVPFGDPATPIFWYQPQGSTTWRVIYADLHVADAASGDLPQ